MEQLVLSDIDPHLLILISGVLALILSAATLYVYRFRSAPELTVYSKWLKEPPNNRPFPYALGGIGPHLMSSKKWGRISILASLLSPVLLFVILVSIKVSLIDGLLGVWFMCWLPGVTGIYASDTGRPEPLAIFLLLLSIGGAVLGFPVVAVLFSVIGGLVLPIVPLMAAASSLSYWPLLGLVAVVIQYLRVKPDFKAGLLPPMIQRWYRSQEKLGLGSVHIAAFFSGKEMLVPWGPLGLLFLLGLGMNASTELLWTSVLSFSIAFSWMVLQHSRSSAYQLAFYPVIVGALVVNSDMLLYLVAFLQPFLAIQQKGSE